MSCNRCSQSSSSPENFLLVCSRCNKYWHHRCHPPPLDNDDLVLLVRSKNAGDRENGLDGWICKRCVKSQAAGTYSKTAAQSLRPNPDDSNQGDLPPFVQSLQTQESLGLPLPNDKRKNDSSVATRSGRGLAGPSIEATTHELHTAEPIQHNDHGSQHLQQQGNHTGSQMRSLDDNRLPTATVKRLQVKRVLQEQHLDGPRVGCDYPINTELCLDQPAVPPSPKYARAQDGKKLVSSEYPPRVQQVMNPLHIKKPVARKEDTPPSSRSVTLFSQRVYSSFTSLSIDEAKHAQSVSAMKSSGGDRQEVGPRKDTPLGNPVGHDDIHMKDESDDLSGPPVLRFGGSTPILSSSETFSEQQGGSVKQEDCQTVQQQGAFQSHHQLKAHSSLKRTPKEGAKPLLGPDWLKARHSFVDDPWRCLCGPQRRMDGVSRRKKSTTKFLGDSGQSVATTDRELLGYLFCHDWVQQTQANIR
ncbi:hypothetical protein CY34DRAFT_799556 [Suillus luteus UH-Slu-Lm8-n1]|uniref:PHD-type domain-containing protein n=1 Tax=Suillus luteus UH-Slu-Lm8-n1 TaxID=930992 RepID=A0A0D0BW78_9AGAM|nr:hypothetical protein CY34DRAFT_799556 [Suillus luteus UH-Slu-Lm8-n1]